MASSKFGMCKGLLMLLAFIFMICLVLLDLIVELLEFKSHHIRII